MMKMALLVTIFGALTALSAAQARDRIAKGDSRSPKPRCRSEKVCRTEESCSAFSNVAQADGSLEITCSDTSIRRICAAQPVCD